MPKNQLLYFNGIPCLEFPVYMTIDTRTVDGEILRVQIESSENFQLFQLIAEDSENA